MRFRHQLTPSVEDHVTVDRPLPPGKARPNQGIQRDKETVERRTWWLLVTGTVLSLALVAFAALSWSAGVLPSAAIAAGLVTFLIADWMDRNEGAIKPINAIKAKVAEAKAAKAAKPAKATKAGESDGATSTSKLLSGLARRGTKVATDIPFELRDIGHALIGPNGLVAVSTQHTHAEWEVTESGIVTRGAGQSFPVPGPILAAKQSAQSLNALALSAGVNATVLPVVILWGPHIADIPGGARTIDGVVVGIGSQAEQWTTLLRSSELTPSQVTQVWDAANTRKHDHVAKAKEVATPKEAEKPAKAE